MKDGFKMLGGYQIAGRAFAMFIALVFAMTAVASAETTSPQAFVEGIYKHYRGKASKGVQLDAKTIPRYFGPPLSDAMVKDFAAAAKAQDAPELSSDPFIDAQDWDISDIKIAVKDTGADRAVATVNMRLFKKPHTLTLDLVRTANGWRIADIRAPSGSLRGLYKLK
jgi:hypothetical protein